MFDLIHLISDYLNYLMLYFLITFIAYVIVMKTRDATKEESWQRKLARLVLGLPFIVLLDLPMNWFSSGVFLDWPDTWNELFTDRMKRYLKLDPSSSFMNLVRYGSARFVCPILSYFDKGHCE